MKTIYAFLFFTSGIIGMEKPATVDDLISATIDGNIPMVQKALNNHVDPAAPNSDKICTALFQRKIDQSCEITTLLFLAIYLNSAPLIRVLCIHSPRLAMQQDEKGETPLTFAAANISDYTPPIQALLDHNAPVNTLNAKGLTPYEVACQHDNYKIAALLKQGTNNSAVANGLSFLYRDRNHDME